jgi:hypothetical protein
MMPRTFQKTFAIFLLLIGIQHGIILGQVPIAEIFAKEVIIPSSVANQIDIALTNGGPGLPHCYRIYICLTEPNWELQAIYGGDATPSWTLSSTTQVYQNPFGSAFGNNINTGFYTFFPALQFDSWFTIQADDTTDPVNLISFESTPPAFTNWDNTGANFTTGIGLGSAISNLPAYPSASGMPDINGKILIAQITTDGNITAKFNFLFRKLNPGGSIFVPLTTQTVQNVLFDLANNPTTPCSAILPITLLEFNGEIIQEGIKTHWITAQEQNNDYFQLKRSSDLINWQIIATIDGAGNSNTQREYEYIDNGPSLGMNYYELDQIDYDGQRKTSERISFDIKYEDSFLLYPNPVSNEVIHIRGPLEFLKSIQVNTIEGKFAQALEYNKLGEITGAEKLQRGVYIVKITRTDNKEIFIKLIKE